MKVIPFIFKSILELSANSYFLIENNGNYSNNIDDKAYKELSEKYTYNLRNIIVD